MKQERRNRFVISLFGDMVASDGRGLVKKDDLFQVSVSSSCLRLCVVHQYAITNHLSYHCLQNGEEFESENRGQLGL